MKSLVVIFVLLSILFTSLPALAGDDEARIVQVFPINDNPSMAWKTDAKVVKIEDRKNGIVCYGLISSSAVGRVADGGYPMTSISCVPIGR